MSDTRVPVVVRLRLPDWREFDVHTEVADAYADGHEGWWLEGNGGCDCNRSLSLNREYGLGLGTFGESGIGDVPCLPCGETFQLIALSIGGRDIPNVSEAKELKALIAFAEQQVKP